MENYCPFDVHLIFCVIFLFVLGQEGSKVEKVKRLKVKFKEYKVELFNFLGYIKRTINVMLQGLPHITMHA